MRSGSQTEVTVADLISSYIYIYIIIIICIYGCLSDFNINNNFYSELCLDATFLWSFITVFLSTPIFTSIL